MRSQIKWVLALVEIYSRPHLDELEEYNQQIQESMIFENHHTPYTDTDSRPGAYDYKSFSSALYGESDL